MSFNKGRIEISCGCVVQISSAFLFTKTRSKRKIHQSASKTFFCAIKVLTFTNFFRIVPVDLLPVVPPVLRALEEVRLAVFVREGSVDVARQTRPGARDQAWVAGRYAFFGQPPVVFA